MNQFLIDSKHVHVFIPSAFLPQNKRDYCGKYNLAYKVSNIYYFDMALYRKIFINVYFQYTMLFYFLVEIFLKKLFIIIKYEGTQIIGVLIS